MSLYETLKVDPKATKEEIKKAYRKMAHKWHPDKENGDKDKFADISKAYAILIDDTARSRYDETGQSDKIDLRKMAQDSVISIFMGIIETNSDESLARMDIIKFIQKSINDNIRNIKESIKKIGKNKKRLSKLLNRLKRKNKKNNIFNAVIGSRINNLNQSVKVAEEQLKMWELSLKIIAEYEDDRPVFKQDDLISIMEDSVKRSFFDRLKEATDNFRGGPGFESPFNCP